MGIDQSSSCYEDYDIENDIFLQPLNEAYRKYFDTFTSIILGNYNDFDKDNEYFTVIFLMVSLNTLQYYSFYFYEKRLH